MAVTDYYAGDWPLFSHTIAFLTSPLPVSLTIRAETDSYNDALTTVTQTAMALAIPIKQVRYSQ